MTRRDTRKNRLFQRSPNQTMYINLPTTTPLPLTLPTPLPLSHPYDDTNNNKKERHATSMSTPGSKAFPFLERIHVQMSEIEQILFIYSTKGTIRVETLPPSLVSFSDNDFSAPRPIIESMQRRYHVLHSQEFLLVMASKDEAAVEEHLRRIRIAIVAIERMMHKHRSSKYYAPLPKCLLSCYSKSGGVDMRALERRYETLKDQVRDYSRCHASSYI